MNFWIFEEPSEREQYNKVLHERNLASYERDGMENKYLVEQAKVMLLEKQLAQKVSDPVKAFQTDVEVKKESRPPRKRPKTSNSPEILEIHPEILWKAKK